MRVHWYTSTLGLTLDTVSVLVTQYNNTAITRTTTIHGDVNSLNVKTITSAIEVASAFAGFKDEINDEYVSPMIYLANGTDGSLPNGKSIPYPTAYVEFDVFIYTTITESSPNCPTGQQQMSGECVCELTTYQPNRHGTIISLPEPYYSAVDSNHSIGAGNYNFFEIDTVSLSNWFVSNKALMSIMPQLSTCFYGRGGHGPPGVKIPVSTLTATSTTTFQRLGHYSSHAAQPVNPVTPLFPAPTSKPPAGSKPSSAPSKESIIAAENTPQSEAVTTYGPRVLDTLTLQSNKASSSPALVLPDLPNSPQPSAENIVHENTPSVQHAPALMFAGSTFTTNSASQFIIAGQTLTQGARSSCQALQYP